MVDLVRVTHDLIFRCRALLAVDLSRSWQVWISRRRANWHAYSRVSRSTFGAIRRPRPVAIRHTVPRTTIRARRHEADVLLRLFRRLASCLRIERFFWCFARIRDLTLDRRDGLGLSLLFLALIMLGQRMPLWSDVDLALDAASLTQRLRNARNLCSAILDFNFCIGNRRYSGPTPDGCRNAVRS